MQGLKDQFKRGITWNAVSVFGNVATHFIGALFIAYFMGPQDSRLIGILLMLMNPAFIMSEFGLATAIVQAKDLRPVHLNTIFVVKLAIGVGLTTLFCVLSPVAAWFFRSPIIAPLMILVSITFFILSTGLVHKARLSRNVNFRALSMAEVAGYITYITIFAFLAWRRKGVWAFAWAKVFQQAVETTYLWISADYTPNFRNISFKETKPMFNFGVNMSTAQIIAFLIGNLDGFLVGRYFSDVSGGYYMYARQIVITPAIRFLKLLTRVSVPILSRLQDDLQRMARSYCLMSKFLALLALPAFVGLSATSPVLIRALFPAKWYPIDSMVSILSLSVLAHLFAALTIVIYYALAKAEKLMRYQVGVLIFRAILLGAVVLCTRNVIFICWAILFERVFFMSFFAVKGFDLMRARVGMLVKYLQHPLIACALMVIVVMAVSLLGAYRPLTHRWATVVLAAQVTLGGAAYIGYIWLKDRHVVDEVKSFLSFRKKPNGAPGVAEESVEAL